MLIFFFEYLIFYFNKLYTIKLLHILTTLLFSFFISFLLFFIKIRFKKFNFFQIIRKYIPKNHLKKSSIPTMGGIIIVFTTTISTILFNNILKFPVFLFLFVFWLYGFIGLLDDLIKIKNKNYFGLSPKFKYFLQSISAVSIFFIIFFTKKELLKDIRLSFSFFSEMSININIILYFFVIYFFLVGYSNAVNLTDGLDGLAIGLVILIFIGFLLISLISGNIIYSEKLNIPYLEYSDEISILCSTIIGSSLAFLWFNAYPAKIFMGDIGSLSLGSIIALIAILLHQEIFLILTSGIFILETLSVILQIICLKFFKKKVFLMAPIHHHFELKGISEYSITIKFWIISFILLFSGFILKVIN